MSPSSSNTPPPLAMHAARRVSSRPLPSYYHDLYNGGAAPALRNAPLEPLPVADPVFQEGERARAGQGHPEREGGGGGGGADRDVAPWRGRGVPPRVATVRMYHGLPTSIV